MVNRPEGVAKPKKQIYSSKSIVIMKLIAALLLFFGCCLFFFQNTSMFWTDIKNLCPFPFIFFAGIAWICIYIANLTGHFESRDLYLADRYDWLYKTVFTITILAMIMRSMFYSLSVPPVIIIICAVSGLMTLATPKIVDNTNDEF
jgi:hypothetical protein